MNDQPGSFTVEEIKRRLSISTLVFHGYRPSGEAALEELARHDIDRIELLEVPSNTIWPNRASPNRFSRFSGPRRTRLVRTPQHIGRGAPSARGNTAIPIQAGALPPLAPR